MDESKNRDGLPDGIGDAEEAAELLRDLLEFPEDPDEPIPEKTKEAIRMILEQSEEANRQFLAGEYMMNPDRVGDVTKASSVMRKLRECGLVSNVKFSMDPGIRPAEITFESDGIALSGDLRKNFADVMETASDYEFVTTMDGILHGTLCFDRMWIPIVKEEDKQ